MVEKINKGLKELEYCAIEQGFGIDLNPLYKYPVINLLLYFKLKNILTKK